MALRLAQSLATGLAIGVGIAVVTPSLAEH
jgi:hypothetical protein